MRIVEAIEHVAVFQHVESKMGKPNWCVLYLLSGRYYVDTRAVKCFLLGRFFLADLGQILSLFLEKRDVIHYGHLIEVVILAKVPITQLYVEMIEVMCSDCLWEGQEWFGIHFAVYNILLCNEQWAVFTVDSALGGGQYCKTECDQLPLVPHNDVSVNDGPHIWRWYHNII